MTITKNEEHVEQGLALFIAFFSDKEKIKALTATYLTQVQELEDAIWEALAQQGLEEVVPGQGAAIGVFLDAIGKIVGESREGKSDSAYVPYIRAKVKANNSDGQTETLYDVLRLILADNTPMRITNRGLDEIDVELVGLPVNEYDYSAAIRFLYLAVSTTVRFLFTVSTETDAFQLSTVYDADESDETTGLGTDYDVSVGGYLTHTFEGI